MVDVPVIPPSERYPGRPAEGRIVVIAPTRAACETIELGVSPTDVETVREREHGEEIRRLAGSGKGFGIVAGTGTGKTLAIRPIAEEIVGLPLRVGVVNREREATPETPTWNVVIVTTGIARRWLQDGLISREDTVVVDEIHQTSAEMELCLALAKRAGCRFIWLSATVDPTFYAEYLDSAEIIESSAFDPARAATVRVHAGTDPLDFLDDRFLRHVHRDKRGVAVFVPTRKETEAIAKEVGERWQKIFTDFYHGGEPIAKLRPFLEGDAPHPYVLSMTAAGQSALNIQGLDTVVIEDAQFTTIVKRGKGVLTRLPLGANEILQMAGRVHGRVEEGEVWILSERDIDFESLEPTAPNFQLAGDPERVAMTCADMGVRADELDLPVQLDRIAYRRAVQMLERRGLIRGNRLTEYGREVEVLPVDRPWGELLVRAQEHMIPVVAACAAIESLHRMTRADRAIGAYLMPGSDHLTAYNLYQDALESVGTLGSVYGLPRHVFEPKALEEWAEERGVLVRAIEDAARALASIYRSLERPLPRTLPRLNERLTRGWQELLAEVMPFDLVIDEETSWGEEVRVSQTSVCGRWGAIAGDLRYFSDRFGRARGSIEGTEIPFDLVWNHAETGEGEIVYEPGHRGAPLRLRRTRTYHGFELEAQEEGIDEFPAGLEEPARRALAEAMAAGAAYHRDARANRTVFRELRDVYRRSGGEAPQVRESELREYFLRRLAGVGSYSEFMEMDLAVDPDELIPAEERKRWEALPDTITLVGDEYPLDYGFEGETPVVRARVPAKLLPQLSEAKLPTLDRPLHWTVLRGKRDAIRAATLEEARQALASDSAEGRRERRRAQRAAAEQEVGAEPRQREGKRRSSDTPDAGERGRRRGAQDAAGAERESRGRRRRHRQRDSAESRTQPRARRGRRDDTAPEAAEKERRRRPDTAEDGEQPESGRARRRPRRNRPPFRGRG
ncbi:MAG: DEAD/DEAH box helicase [Longimicrobiaceae bacterium]